MPLRKKWKSMDLFNFSARDSPFMENVNNVFSQISQSHAGSLLRNRRLGSLSSVKTDDGSGSQRKDDASDATSPPLLQRTAIIQKDEKGYGLTVSGDNPVYVASVKTGGAAEKAGVQTGDKIIKVNGKLVTNSNHTEVVKMIRSGSYVALTLLGKPFSGQSSNVDRNSSPASFRESIVDKITGPQPVDAEKEREVRQQKVNTIRVMYETAHEEYDKLKKAYKANPSEKLQAQIQEKDKTLKILEAQLQNLPPASNRDSQVPSVNVDESLSTDNSSISSWLPKKERKHMKHSSSPGAMYRPSESQPRATANVCRSKSDVSSRKNALSEYGQGSQGYKRTESSPEGLAENAIKKIKKSASFRGFRRSNAQRKKSSVFSRTNSFRRKFGKPKMPIRKTASVPATVSDLGSDSPRTSPSTSPTPTHYQNLEGDAVPVDSGIEDGSQSSIGMTSRANMPIIGMDDDDFASEDESMEGDRRSKSTSPFLSKLQSFETGDSRVFSDLSMVEARPAHMAVFLHYVLNHHNPSPLLFYYLAGIYSTAQGSSKDLKKWAYEIHSTFIIHNAPLKVANIEDHVVQEIDANLQFRSEKEEALRGLFSAARATAQRDVTRLLDDLRQKKEQGLIEGSNDLKDHMDKNEELRILEKYLSADLERCVEQGEEDDKQNALSWAIATFLRHGVHKSSSHSSILERVPSFVTKDKRGSKFSSKQKKSQKGHQFVLTHIYKQEFCLHCNKVLWGVGFQGYQCQTCDQCVHKQCVEDLEENCNKKKKRVSTLGVFKPKPTQGGVVRSALSDLITAATPIISDPDKDQVSSPTGQPNVFTQPLKGPEDNEITAFRDAGHSVINLVGRFESSPDSETPGGKRHFQQKPQGQFSPRHNRRNAMTIRQGRRLSSIKSMSLPAHIEPPRKNADLGRSESMKGRGDQSQTRPARRSKSDVDMDENMLRAITTSGSSSASSLRSTESPSSSMDTLTSQIADDSDFDVEPELPSLKQVLGEDTVRRLKPKEKKRQDVINELFYTEKCHVRSLKILDKLFYKPMLKEQSIPQEFTKSLFPNLETMTHLHGSLNNAMKTRRKEKSVISTVGDLLLQRFDGEAGENFRNGCAIFCRNQSHALEGLKVRSRKEPKMNQLLSDAENNPLCHRLALKDIIPKQFMRLTKYPLLIENLLKYTQTSTEEYTNLERALQCSKHILEYVNQAVKDCENHQRLIDLQRRIDKKLDNSSEVEDLKTFDLSKHKLLHDGSLTWRINNKKQIELHVVLLERAMVLLQKAEERLVLKLQATQLVAGREDAKRHSPLLWLNNVLARNDATDRRAFFVVNTSKAGPQIYQLVASSADEQKRWTKQITQASDAMKKNEINLKKKPVPAQPVTDQVSVEENHVEMPEIDEDNLVHPEDVTCNDPAISTAVQVISPIEKLRQNDENLAAVLVERQNVIAEILKVDPADVPEKTQEVTENDDSTPQELIAACENQALQLVDMMKDTPLSALQPTDSGEQFESIEDMPLPIPMDKLKDMASRMNMILTNLLVGSRPAARNWAAGLRSNVLQFTGRKRFSRKGFLPEFVDMHEAAVNKRDEERDRLRRELKFAQDELNRLRRIQKLQLEMEAAKESGVEGGVEGGGTVEQGRPSSIVSEASTVSESEPEQQESDLTSGQETDNNEDAISMPGLPIEPEPEIASEFAETLNEVCPVNVETIPDLDTEELTELKEAEVEEVKETLHELDPPEEDEIEDSDTPIIELVDPSDGGSSDDENSDDDSAVTKKDTGDKLSDSGPGPDTEEGTDVNSVTCVPGGDKVDGENEDDKSDIDNGKTDSADVFHDAENGEAVDDKVCEGSSAVVDSSCSSNGDSLSADRNNKPEGGESSDKHEAQTEAESDNSVANDKSSQDQTEDDKKTDLDEDSGPQTDKTINSLGDSTSEQV